MAGVSFPAFFPPAALLARPLLAPFFPPLLSAAAFWGLEASSASYDESAYKLKFVNWLSFLGMENLHSSPGLAYSGTI